VKSLMNQAAFQVMWVNGTAAYVVGNGAAGRGKEIAAVGGKRQKLETERGSEYGKCPSVHRQLQEPRSPDTHSEAND